ncbi:uncharacterized protein A1O9_03908 [Exophiala aquamarina CBS 119918]|uniref:Xylanolytic transcriptional activator regulatory domain-containing protein n=1 Tax=Exophiala aquamarina CBS 119918 TaxID=1182545 RepID=A0A072PU43_9EURO|nr:uncharacterized protein A1O9_03908 [Exophiala aquamarina CBS 119918]KEF59065.1 hypothetical protein A1O9_03908 [Exophiala aquamarina CBS 119918]
MTAALMQPSQSLIPRETTILTSNEVTKCIQPTSNISSIQSPMLAASKPVLPPAHILLFAADVYFKYCHNHPYSLFHEGRFRERLAAGEVPEYLVWAFLASSRRFSTIPHHHFEGGDSVGSLAKRSWETFNVPWDGPKDGEEALAIMQTVILLVCVEHTAGHCSSAFLKLGFATRAAQLFRFHMEPDSSLDPISQEERRRAFWGVHLQDRLMSLSRERPPILRDEDCSVHLPCSDDAFHANRYEEAPSLAFLLGDGAEGDCVEKCAPLALIPVMVSGLNRVSQYVLQDRNYSLSPPPWLSNSPFATIESFLSSIEMHFDFAEPLEEVLERVAVKDGALDHFTASPILYARALYSLSQCLLHHPFLLKDRLQRMKQRIPSRFMARVWKTCRLHAKLITDIRRVRNGNVLILTCFYGYCTMMAGTIHALSQHDDDPAVREEASKNFEADLRFMRELSSYWQHAALITSRLERFNKHSVGYYNQIMRSKTSDPATHSEGPTQAIWQAVDHWALSMPTRPNSPSDEPSSVPESFTSTSMISPHAIFDFGDLGMLEPFSEPANDPCAFSLANFTFGSSDFGSQSLY